MDGEAFPLLPSTQSTLTPETPALAWLFVVCSGFVLSEAESRSVGQPDLKLIEIPLPGAGIKSVHQT